MSQTAVDERVPSAWTQREDGHWDTDIYGEWTDEEERWIEGTARLIDHMLNDHDPIECQRDVDPVVLDEIGRLEWAAIREGEQLTLRQLAGLLNVDAGTISRYETGSRWPENTEYLRWLQETDQTQIRANKRDFITAILKRGGWFQTEKAKTGPGVADLYDTMWEVVYKPGGLLDKFRETGTLPHWKPADAEIHD